MAHHQLIAFKDLRADVLHEIGQTHRMTSCPLCAGGLTTACGLGPAEEYRACVRCSTVWQLVVHHMGPDGGHFMVLAAYANCYCREELLERTRVHEVRPGDAQACPEP